MSTQGFHMEKVGEVHNVWITRFKHEIIKERVTYE